MKSIFPCVILAFIPLATPAGGQSFSFTEQVTTFGTQTQAGFTAWLPSDVSTIRGMALILPGSCGNTLFATSLAHWRRAAESLGFGLIGSNDGEFSHDSNTGCAWGSPFDDEPRLNLERILNRVAEISGHSEITNAPVLASGTSQGGFNAWLVATNAAERTIGYASVRGFAPPVELSPEARELPGILLPGARDGTVRPHTAVYPGFTSFRGQDAPITFAPEWGRGHDSGQSTWELAWYWMSEVTKQRYPDELQPSLSPGELIDLEELDSAAAWYGEAASFLPSDNPRIADVVASPFPEIGPAATYSGDTSEASWLPSEAFANAYRARTLIDLNRPLGRPPGQFFGGPMEIVSPESFLPGNLDVSREPPLLRVGDKVNLSVEPNEFDDSADITSMQFYLGDQFIGEDLEGPNWMVPVLLDAEGIQGLTVVATNSVGEQTSAFRAILVQPAEIPEPSSSALSGIVFFCYMICRRV